MHIAFKFEYIHDNGLFTRLLKRIEAISDVSLHLYNDGHTYTIEASGDQPTLETLAEQISKLVPQSLFLKESKIEAVEKEEGSEEVKRQLSESAATFKVPYCPECQERVVASLNPFNPCDVCGFSDTSLTFEALTYATGIEATSAETFFNDAADFLVKQGELTLPTHNGVRRFSLPGSERVGQEGVLYCDPIDISSNFLITQGELDALMMVEKPSIRLKPKLMFRVEHELEEPFYPLFFADDKITLALSTALKNKGIDAIFCDNVPTLRVASALEEHFIITPGRDMLPWHVSKRLENPSFCAYGDFQAYGDSNGLQVDKTIAVENKPFIRYVANSEKSEIKNAISFEPAHGAQRSIVVEHMLEGKALCGIHLSREYHVTYFLFFK